MWTVSNMIRSLGIVFCLFVGGGLYGQSYLGHASKPANLRSGPSTEYDKLLTAQPGDNLFIYDAQIDGDFYKVIHIATNTEGFVHRSLVRLDTPSAANSGGLFIPTGRTASYRSDLEVFNNTELTLTLKMNGRTYVFSPKERNTLELGPGSYSYVASAPGVVPDHGTERIDSGTSYSWQFYIVTR